jgi:hypothetical protein
MRCVTDAQLGHISRIHLACGDLLSCMSTSKASVSSWRAAACVLSVCFRPCFLMLSPSVSQAPL